MTIFCNASSLSFGRASNSEAKLHREHELSVQVYASSPWQVAAAAKIRNLAIAPPATLPAYFAYFNGFMLSKGNLLGLVSLPSVYVIRCHLFPTADGSTWRNIYHLTASGTDHGTFSRLPCLHFCSGKCPTLGLELTLDLSPAAQPYRTTITTESLPLNQWRNIIITIDTVAKLMTLAILNTGSGVTESTMLAAIAVPDPRYAPWPSVQVYASDPWHDAASARISHMAIYAATSINPSMQNAGGAALPSTYYPATSAPNGFILIAKNLVGVVALPAVYTVSFDLFPTSKSNFYRNIIHLTGTGEDHDAGGRLPIVQFTDGGDGRSTLAADVGYKGSVADGSAHTTGVFLNPTTPLTLNGWSTLVITVDVSIKIMTYSVSGATTISTLSRTFATPIQATWPRTQVWASDIFSPAAAASIRNLMIRSPTPPPTLKPIALPTLKPIALPTLKPIALPTLKPIALPTLKPIALPTLKPIALPTLKPIALPTLKPIALPTLKPIALPTLQPITSDSSVPDSGAVTFGFTGSVVNWKVTTTDMYTIDVMGSGTGSGGAKGGYVSISNVRLTAGSMLEITVGGLPTGSTGGFGGGGNANRGQGGAGASIISLSLGSAANPSNILIVAGGAGGDGNGGKGGGGGGPKGQDGTVSQVGGGCKGGAGGNNPPDRDHLGGGSRLAGGNGQGEWGGGGGGGYDGGAGGESNGSGCGGGGGGGSGYTTLGIPNLPPFTVVANRIGDSTGPGKIVISRSAATAPSDPTNAPTSSHPTPAPSSSSTANTPNPEGAALCDFYDGLTAGKSSLTNWCVGSAPYSPCGSSGTSTWLGVTCGAVGGVSRVVRLDVNRYGLTGSIPSTVGSLLSITKLDLGINRLSGSLPSQLWTLTSLQFLGLNQNKLTGTLPSNVGNLLFLTWLNLWGNSLSGSLPSQLGLLTNLQRLVLNTNQFTFAVPASFCSLGVAKSSFILQLQSNPGLTCLPACLSNPPYTKLQFDAPLAKFTCACSGLATDKVTNQCAIPRATATDLAVQPVPVAVSKGQQVSSLSKDFSNVYVASAPLKAFTPVELPPSLVLAENSVRTVGPAVSPAGSVDSAASASTTSIQSVSSAKAINQVAAALSKAGIAVQANPQPKTVVVQVQLSFVGSCFAAIDFTKPAESGDAALIIYQGISQLTLSNLNESVFYDAGIRGSTAAAKIAMNAAFKVQNSMTPAQVRTAANQIRLKFTPIVSRSDGSTVNGVAVNFNNSMALNLLLVVSGGGLRNVAIGSASGASVIASNDDDTSNRNVYLTGRRRAQRATPKKRAPTRAPTAVPSAAPAPLMSQADQLSAFLSQKCATASDKKVCEKKWKTQFKPVGGRRRLQAGGMSRFRACLAGDGQLLGFGAIDSTFLILEERMFPATRLPTSARPSPRPTHAATRIAGSPTMIPYIDFAPPTPLPTRKRTQQSPPSAPTPQVQPQQQQTKAKATPVPSVTPTSSAGFGRQDQQPQQLPQQEEPPSAPHHQQEQEQEQDQQHSASSSEASSATSLSDGAIAGIAVAVLLVLAAMVAAAFVLNKSKGKSGQYDPRVSGGSFSHHDVYGHRLRDSGLQFEPHIAGGGRAGTRRSVEMNGWGTRSSLSTAAGPRLSRQYDSPLPGNRGSLSASRPQPSSRPSLGHAPPRLSVSASADAPRRSRIITSPSPAPTPSSVKK